MQGKCLLEPVAAAEAGRQTSGISGRLSRAAGQGVEGDSLHPALSVHYGSH